MRAAANTSGFSRFSPFAKLYFGKTQIRFYIERLGLKFAPHHVLLALGARADWRGESLGESKVKLSTIQQLSGYSRRGVQMALRELEEMGEIETVKRVNAKGRQRCNGYRLIGMLKACGLMKRDPEPGKAAAEEVAENQNEGGTTAPLKWGFSAENCAPIPEDSSSEESPYPQNEKPQSEPKPRKARRGMSEEKIEEERQLEALALEALHIHKELAAPSWRRMLWDTRRARFWLARRILRMGGLEQWRKILQAARTSPWLKSRDFGLAFFSSPSVIAAIEAGGYGVSGEGRKSQAQPSGPLSFTEERLKAEPWLKYAQNLDAWLSEIPLWKLGDLKEEAAKIHKLFGKAAECYAVWRSNL